MAHTQEVRTGAYAQEGHPYVHYSMIVIRSTLRIVTILYHVRHRLCVFARLCVWGGVYVLEILSIDVWCWGSWLAMMGQ